MQEIETLKGEKVLEPYYSERLNKMDSMTLYSYFVGSELPKDKLYVVIGTDSGLLIEFLETIVTPGQRYVFLDKPEVVDYLKNSRISALHDKFELYDFDSFEFESLYEHHQDYVVRNAIILLKSLAVDDDNGVYRGVFSQIEELFQRFRIDRVDNRNFKKIFDQQLMIVCDLQHPLSTIKDRLKGTVPAVILGGGPSLDDVIPWLKAHQSKIWIFAASRICKRLVKEGITPDFIATLDPQPLIFEYSKEMFEFADKSILITGEHPYPGLIKQWKGLKAYTRRRFPWSKGGEDNFISDGPTITNALFGMAVYLGVTEIYLAGVDFCFTPEGVCHESGSVESQTGVRDKLDTVAVNYAGQTVGTNIQLYDARNLFESQLARFQNEYMHLKAYNLNSGAAVIKGIDYLSTCDVCLGENKFNVVQAFQSDLHRDAVSELRFLKYLKSEINHYTKWLLDISRVSKEGVQLTKKLFKTPSKQASRIKEIVKLKAKLEKIVGADYRTMVNYAHDDFMLTLQPVESEEDMSRQEIINSFQGFFGGLKTASTGFVEKLEWIRLDIKQREIELDSATDFTVLASSWIADNIPGRFYVWLNNFTENRYDDMKQRYPSEVAQLESLYKEVIADDSALISNMNLKVSNEDDFVERILQSFSLKQPLVIRSIIKELKSLPKERFAGLLGYAQGMLNELQGAPEKALNDYLEVDGGSHMVFIQARIYSLAFSLKKFEQGIESLQALCLLDSGYMPKFAETLDVLGNPQGAIDVYDRYPFLLQDTDAMIHLLRLLVAQGEVERANSLLQQAEVSQSIDQPKLKLFIDTLNTPDTPG